jgi:predicted lipoprotein with Yx(FWY)xxD motif
MKNLIATMVLVLTAATATSAQEKPTDPAEKTQALTTEVINDENEVLLADSFGKTLYTFDLDTGSNTSKCKGDCAEVWPPYIITTEESATLAPPLGTILRANKKLQLTYQGQPLYTYIFDRTLTDEKGDGIGGVWHYIEIKKPAVVVTPAPVESESVSEKTQK